ncbi:HNH endonuclease [Paenibacillus sp. JX-17]|uniref:HNH endonuclease n=1 Tax=Paenibacillus lacisoli TaxID=3064525 RepID=A0ABT9CAR3_9BACL|nr:HNH endonuclease [Paenibacillus sp. JX-17]MDO7906350.1 HNH endonuclease [Paenibacillus sp. JX-17]
MHTEPSNPSGTERTSKYCTYCQQHRPLTDFRRRTGAKSGKGSRRGACRICRQERSAAKTAAVPEAAVPRKQAVHHPPAQERPFVKRKERAAKRPPPAVHTRPDPHDHTALRPNRAGMIRMRGRTDKGRKWHQEIELELAITLVKEHAAEVVNRTTIRRLYSNKEFRRYILLRDRYTCRFCGRYGDTIDHLLPRAKGGHTTPYNCVCACNMCNQSKADRDVDEFMLNSSSFRDAHHPH